MERDAEAQLEPIDHTKARQYPANLGRWLSPDPGAVEPDNPQTWNRYDYALNNPLVYIDPDGDSSISAVYRLGTASVKVFVPNEETLDAAALLGSVTGGVEPLPMKDLQSGNAIGSFRDLISSGGCLLACVSTFNEEPVGVTLSLSFGYDEKTGNITGVGITPSIDSSANFIGPNPAPQRAAATPFPGIGPPPEVFSVRIDSGVLKGLSGAQLEALKKEVSNPNRSSAIYDAIRAAVLEEQRRRAEEERKRKEEEQKKECQRSKEDCP